MNAVTLEFVVNYDDAIGKWRLFSSSLAGLLPVGSRLLRGRHMDPKYVSSEYDTEAEAKEAKLKWEQYRDAHLTGGPTKKRGGKIAKKDIMLTDRKQFTD